MQFRVVFGDDALTSVLDPDHHIFLPDKELDIVVLI